MTKKYDVVGIGNAIVDVLAFCDDAFLKSAGIEKGIMQLIDTERSSELYAMMSERKEVSGGSAANTIAGLAALGGKTAYVGKVKADTLGDVFEHDMKALGADYEVPRAPKTDAAETGRCMVMVTPDGERSMNTYLGVTEFLSPDDIDVEMMADTDWIYLEGYRFDGPESHAAFAKAIEACKGAKGKVSLTLSDPFCVERHRDAFKALIADHADLLFCNEHELMSLYETDDLETALEATSKAVAMTACTLGEKGAVVVEGDHRTYVPTEATKVVDATGAGDLFAAGFLYGITQGADHTTCARMGCIAAGEIISHIGARPEADLKTLFKTAGVV